MPQAFFTFKLKEICLNQKIGNYKFIFFIVREVDPTGLVSLESTGTVTDIEDGKQFVIVTPSGNGKKTVILYFVYFTVPFFYSDIRKIIILIVNFDFR